MEPENKVFDFTYSPQTQRDVQQIYERYAQIKMEKATTASAESPAVQKIKALDKSAKQRAAVWTAAVGVLAALVFGAGLALVITTTGLRFAFGVIVGVIGLSVLVLEKAIYRALLHRQMKRCADDVLALAAQFFTGETTEPHRSVKAAAEKDGTGTDADG